MKFIEEIWKPVVGYEGIYEVSSLGRVKSCERTIIRKDGRKMNVRGKIMKPSIIRIGYEQIDLSKKDNAETVYVHRLVGKAFIENPYNKEQINHKNGVKTDNRVENLEWVTSQENMRHAFKNGLRDDDLLAKLRRKKVDQLTLEGHLIKTFDSIKDAIDFTGAQNISDVCRNVRNTSGGFKWRYSTEVADD